MKVLVIAPHPDDDAIGCGGTIRKHVVDGDFVHTVYLTSGEKGIPGEELKTTAHIREEEARVCSQILGTHLLTFLHEPDGSFESTPSVRNNIINIINSEEIDMMYLPHLGEDHPDHENAAFLANIAESVEAVRFYAIWNPLATFDVKVNITEFADYKRAAIRAYVSQDTRNCFSEATMALNHYYGLLYGPHWMYAEVFIEERK